MKLMGRPSEFIKLFIPNNYVTKMIGVGGCIIRDIASKSGGAQITINSSKESEKKLRDCTVLISGTLANKQDAACLVIFQLQTLKLITPHYSDDNLPIKPYQPETRYEHKNTEQEISLTKRESFQSKTKTDLDESGRKNSKVRNFDIGDSMHKALPPPDCDFYHDNDPWMDPPLRQDYVWPIRYFKKSTKVGASRMGCLPQWVEPE